jgi:hypothetical protein
VAAAIRWLAKAAVTDRCHEIMTPHRASQLRKNIIFDQCLGQRVVTEFLQNVPGINTNTINQQLANLKASDDYARIIGEVADAGGRELADAAVISLQFLQLACGRRCRCWYTGESNI